MLLGNWSNYNFLHLDVLEPSLAHCNIIRTSTDTQEQKWSSRNGQRNTLSEWHSFFIALPPTWNTLFHFFCEPLPPYAKWCTFWMPPYKDYNSPPYNVLQHCMLQSDWKFWILWIAEKTSRTLIRIFTFSMTSYSIE